MNHLIRFLLIAWLAQATAFSATHSPAAFIQRLKAGEKITIVTMGTSLTGGQWRWPDVMLTDWLNKDFPGQVRLVNEGVGASASSVGPGNNHALSGIGKLPAVLAHQPDVVFIEFSINDAYLPYKITQDDSKRNLNTLIDRIIAANPKTEIIIQTMNPVKSKPEHGGDAAATQRPHLADYVEAYRQVAKARSLRLVDHYPNWLRLMQDKPAEFDKLIPDGVHPQTAGYRAVLLPELKKSLLPPPAVGQAYLQHPAADGMTVCWLAQTDAVRDAGVVLTSPMTADVPAREFAIPNTAFSIWRARLTGLSPGVTYHYQVRYRLEDGPHTMPPRHFRTLDPHAGSLRAIAFNDTHMGAAAMAALLKHVKPEEFELTLLLGDILEGSNADGSDLFAAWDRYVELLDGSQKPIVFVRGNHDTRGAFAKRLAFLFDLPNLDPTRPWGEEQWQFTLRAGPVSFLALDTGEDDDDGTPATSYKNPELWQQVRQRQAAWIKQTVAAKPPDAPAWRVLLTHMPLYNSPWCSVRSRNLWTPMLREWQPDLALSGHDHQWRAAQPLAQGDPWPTLVGGGPAMGPGEEATLMILTADSERLTVRLLGAKDGRQLTEFVGVPTPQRDQQLGLTTGGSGAWQFYPAANRDPALPRVLLIGDSICNGYRGVVSRKLTGKATVDVWLTPAAENDPGLYGDLEKVLKQGPYAVVHFNIGLHGWPKGRIPEGQYEPLMRKYVEVLRKHAPDAKIIWASSTPITVKDQPAQLDPEDNPTITARNAIAARIMQESGIAVNDLYGMIVEHRAQLGRGDRFHWKAPAYELMGRQITDRIAETLPAKP